jgi:hypothetical protein
MGYTKSQSSEKVFLLDVWASPVMVWYDLAGTAPATESVRIRVG